VRHPVSFAQQRLWSAPGGLPLHLAHTIWLDGPVAADVLQRAVDAVVSRHAALRTGFATTDGVPEQVVADEAMVLVERVTLPDGRDGTTARAESIAGELAVRPFDLAVPPLLRAALITVTPGVRSLFVLVGHRLISDPASMSILLAELSTEYRAELAATPAVLPPLWMDHGDYAVWQRDRLRGEELGRQLGYWRPLLRDAPTVLTPRTGLPRSCRGAVVSATVDAATTRRLRDVARAADTTLFVTFLAGYAVALARCTRQTDLVIGTPVSGRNRVELAPVVGPFATTVPLRISLAGAPAFSDLLGRVREATQALAHDELPFEKLVEEFPRVGQVRFAHQARAVPVLDLPGVTARGHVLPTGTTTADLTLCADTSVGDESTLVLEYATDLVDTSFADEVVRSVAAVLEHVARAPEMVVTDLPTLSPPQAVSPDVVAPEPVPVTPEPPPAAAPVVMSRGEVEVTMARIWGELLRTPTSVGSADNVFALGANSLAVIRFVARIAETYGVTLTMDEVFAAPVVGKLAEFVADTEAVADTEFVADTGREEAR
jgi:acyl carrier protein